MGAPLVRLRWVFTDQKFPPVGTHNVITNRIWDEDQVTDLTIGQVQPCIANYEQDARWRLPAGMRPGHTCHPEWFGNGEPYPNDLPPNVYGPNWIPECCGLLQDATAGGVAIGGEVGDKFYPPDPTYGGVAIGGEVGDTFVMYDPTAGGVELGGEVGDVYRPPDATEGGIEIGGEAGDVYDVASGSWVRDVAGDYTFTAVHTGPHLLRYKGGGGRGADATGGGGMGIGGGGGGGGAAANVVLSLVAGTDYPVTVGAGGAAEGGAAGDTFFKIGSTYFALAVGGDNAVGLVGGTGGDAVSCIGDQTWDGGTGAEGVPVGSGGGGGSSGCYSPTGIPPGTGADADLTTGGVAPLPDGGNGADAGDNTSGGAPGGAPGGGGSGAGADATDPGGNGADGLMSIVWPPI